jgi:hypothetical protein
MGDPTYKAKLDGMPETELNREYMYKPVDPTGKSTNLADLADSFYYYAEGRSSLTPYVRRLRGAADGDYYIHPDNGDAYHIRWKSKSETTTMTGGTVTKTTTVPCTCIVAHNGQNTKCVDSVQPTLTFYDIRGAAPGQNQAHSTLAHTETLAQSTQAHTSLSCADFLKQTAATVSWACPLDTALPVSTIKIELEASTFEVPLVEKSSGVWSGYAAGASSSSSIYVEASKGTIKYTTSADATLLVAPVTSTVGSTAEAPVYAFKADSGATDATVSVTRGVDPFAAVGMSMAVIALIASGAAVGVLLVIALVIFFVSRGSKKVAPA